MKQAAFLLLLITQHAFGQTDLLKTGENLVFGFKTKNNKQVLIARSSDNAYLVYRYGNARKIELEYPGKKDTSSWADFSYSYWLRGGGKMNEGIDLNYLYFTIGEYKYIVYDTYFAVDDKYDVGVKVINMKNGKDIIIEGNVNSQKGSLNVFRDSLTVSKGDELFD